MKFPSSPPEGGNEPQGVDAALVPIGSGETIAFSGGQVVLPAILTSGGDDAITRFVEFFTANIQNRHTRRAYFRNALAFLRWCDKQRISSLKDVKPFTVAAYIEFLRDTHSKPTIKQKLATIRMLFDFLVIGQVVPINPAHAVRGPKHVVTKGKTLILTPEETRLLFESIPSETVVDKRDRALIATMFFTFARVSAVVGLSVKDYYPVGKRFRLLFSEKGSKQHEMPCNHRLEEFLDAYIQAAAIGDDNKAPLFRTATSTGKALTTNRLSPADVWRMIRRRALAAGVNTRIGCHSFRATGITNYLGNKGTLEKAQQMAAHASPRTTKLYDRTIDQITLDEVEKITL